MHLLTRTIPPPTLRCLIFRICLSCRGVCHCLLRSRAELLGEKSLLRDTTFREDLEDCVRKLFLGNLVVVGMRGAVCGQNIVEAEAAAFVWNVSPFEPGQEYRLGIATGQAREGFYSR